MQQNASLTFRQSLDFTFDFAIKNIAQVRRETEASIAFDRVHICGLLIQKIGGAVVLKFPSEFGEDAALDFSNIYIVAFTEFAMTAISQVLSGNV